MASLLILLQQSVSRAPGLWWTFVIDSVLILLAKSIWIKLGSGGQMCNRSCVNFIGQSNSQRLGLWGELPCPDSLSCNGFFIDPLNKITFESSWSLTGILVIDSVLISLAKSLCMKLGSNEQMWNGICIDFTMHINLESSWALMDTCAMVAG